MPRKINFSVVQVSAEDENFPASELNLHGPTVKGWLSKKEVSLADNLHSEYKSRELKSVLVDAIGDFVKFLIHANHVNKYNVYNQVGIVALNVIGDDVQGLDGSEEDELQKKCVDAAVCAIPALVNEPPSSNSENECGGDEPPTQVQKLYSKNFIQREEAFKEMQRYLERYNSRRSRHSAEDVLKAVTFLLQRGARDKVLSVFIQALNLMQTLFTRFTIVQRISKGDVTVAVNKTVPRILYRTGDTAPRVKSVAIDFLLEMGDYEDVKAVQAMLHNILRPFPESTNPRLAQGRCELVEQLVARFPPLSQSDPLFEHMMAFAIRALSHPSLQVREVAEQILLSLYRLLGTPVRQCLVPESTKTSRNFTYKKVFEEFEKIDKEPGSAQRPPRRQRSASADSPSSGSGRRDFVKEVAAPSSRSLQELPKASQQEQSAFNLDKMCMFCEETNEKFNAETLNYHYWTECPMLMLCYNCKQASSIGMLYSTLCAKRIV
ncbi:hypothetical protein V5799_019072 [Amblyomma americanum]|uniref:TOG domain-containing protein n=1 Tax=Amblyomma americanum TaxID=6943 RepID=A0AAQ4EY95_AMBAM